MKPKSLPPRCRLGCGRFAHPTTLYESPVHWLCWDAGHRCCCWQLCDCCSKRPATNDGVCLVCLSKLLAECQLPAPLKSLPEYVKDNRLLRKKSRRLGKIEKHFRRYRASIGVRRLGSFEFMADAIACLERARSLLQARKER